MTQRKARKPKSRPRRRPAASEPGTVPPRPRPQEESKEAAVAWAKISRQKRLAIVREVVETRHDELRRAYPQVIGVMSGLKRTRKTRRDAELLRKPEPAVIFVVDRKRAEKDLQPDDRIQPLYHYCTVNRRRRLCQVPIDVEEVRSFSAIRPGSNGQVSVNGEAGVVCCAVRVPLRDTRPLAAVSCCHLFRKSGMKVTFAGQRLGTVKHLGTLVPEPRISCDVALALDVDRFVLRDALDRLKITLLARDLDDIPQAGGVYWIRTPNGALAATYRGDFTGVFSYDDVGPVQHTLLIQSRMLQEPAIAGYSGAPVTTRRDGGMLLGMHIAGDGDDPNGPGDTALMIPIWHVLQTSNYMGLPPGKRLHVQKQIT